jgi:hypothetical protein
MKNYGVVDGSYSPFYNPRQKHANQQQRKVNFHAHPIPQAASHYGHHQSSSSFGIRIRSPFLSINVRPSQKMPIKNLVLPLTCAPPSSKIWSSPIPLQNAQIHVFISLMIFHSKKKEKTYPSSVHIHSPRKTSVKQIALL